MWAARVWLWFPPVGGSDWPKVTQLESTNPGLHSCSLPYQSQLQNQQPPPRKPRTLSGPRTPTPLYESTDISPQLMRVCVCARVHPGRVLAPGRYEQTSAQTLRVKQKRPHFFRNPKVPFPSTGFSLWTVSSTHRAPQGLRGTCMCLPYHGVPWALPSPILPFPEPTQWPRFHIQCSPQGLNADGTMETVALSRQP